MRLWILKTCIILCTLQIIAGCTSHTIDTNSKVETVHTIEIKPMHITIDVNLKVDKQLDNFFDDIDKQDETMKETK